MKKWCLIVIVFLALANIVIAQTVSTAELKSVLIDSIKDYLSSQTPKLEKAELKDLIVVYLSTKGNTADLSGNGPFSGKKFIDVYNKAKGITPPITQTCSAAGGSCKPNACNTYTNCASLSTGTCASGLNCCSGNCIPQGAEILPWGMLGVAGWGPGNPIVYGLAGQKKTYIFRVPSGTKVAGGAFFAYDPATVFNFTFTSVPGYKWRGYESYTGTISYSGDAGFDFTPQTMTPTTTDGFVPPGDYMVEITWTNPPYIPYGCPGCLGRIAITTAIR